MGYAKDSLAKAAQSRLVPAVDAGHSDFINQNKPIMSKQTADVSAKKHLNEGLGLEAIDYENMEGENYSRYLDIVNGNVQNPTAPKHKQVRGGGLPGQQMFTFEVMDVRPIIRQVYDGIDGSPKYCDGFTIVSRKPKMVTNTYLKHVIGSTGNNGINSMLTAQIGGTNANSVPIFYYLLQKPPVKE
jgi:hypothetical protein